MNIHIEQALYNFRTNGGRYQRFCRYYDGDHHLAFATEKFENTFGSLFREFALNLCPAVCDAVTDKLKVEGFAVRSSSFSLPARTGEMRHAKACTPNIETATDLAPQPHGRALRGGP